MDVALPEVHPEVDLRPDLPGLEGAQCPCKYHMGKDEGSLGDPLLIEYPSPLHSQYCSEPVPHLTGGLEYQLSGTNKFAIRRRLGLPLLGVSRRCVEESLHILPAKNGAP